MRTANEMYAFCLEKGFGQGYNKSQSLKHFSVIEKALFEDEDVLMCFTGIHNYVSMTKHDSNYAYAITKKRVIMGQKKVIGESIQTVFLDNINDITYSSGMLFGVITVDTIKEKFNVALDKAQAENINSQIHNVLHELKSNKTSVETPLQSNISSADELRKYKSLLDDGIISQDEFDQKKKQLLGI